MWQSPRFLFLFCVALSVGIAILPYGRQIGYPLMLLFTLVHEAGHGVAALLVGGSWSEFHMFSDGSGYASVRYSGKLASAITSAGGLVGPAIASMFGFAFSIKPRASRLWLGFLAIFFLWLLIFKASIDSSGSATDITHIFVGTVVALCGLSAFKANALWCQLLTLFLSIQLGMSVFSRGDYLFTPTANTSVGTSPSDVGHMAEALGGPSWLWGAVCAAISVAALCFGLYIVLRYGGNDEAPTTATDEIAAKIKS